MSTLRIAQLHTVARQSARLFAGPSLGLSVDEAAGIIRDVAVMTAGAAKGHGFSIDATTLRQTFDLLAALPDGARVRMKHPAVDANGIPSDGTGTTVGRLKNPRLVGNQIRGDVYLGSYAAMLPGVGDARSYFLRQAKEDPAAIGLSAVIHFDVENTATMPARVYQVDAVDFAEDPAANPRGLLSSQSNLPGASPGIVSSQKGVPSMELLQLLQSLGLDPSATAPEQIDQFVAGLTPDQQAAAAAAGWKTGWAPMSSAPPATTAPAAVPATPPAAPAAPAPAAMSVPGTASVAQLKAENTRVTQIRQLTVAYRLPDEFGEQHIGAGTEVGAYLTAARAELARRFKPTGAGAVNVGDDRNVASLAAGVSDGIRLRAGVKVKNPHERSREFQGLTLVETCRAYLNAIGLDTRSMGSHEVARLVFNRPRLANLGRAQLAQSTGDFSNILGDSINKTLRMAYEETPSTWETWGRRGTATDFKSQKRVALSGAPDLLLVAENGEYKDGGFSDSGESFYLAKYGRIVNFSWESIVNDDLDAFSRIPTAMGQAAKRKEDDVFYYALLKNAVLSDTGALFNSTALTTAGGHANYTTGAGAPSVTTLNTAVQQMSLQRAPAEAGAAVGTGPVLNLQPKYMPVPPALAGTTWELLNSTSYAVSNGNANIKNRFGPGGQVSLQAIVEPRLQNGVTLNGDTVTGSSTAWYLAADTSMIDTIELAFLASEPAPVTEEQDGFRVDGRSYKIRHAMQAKAIDYRGLYKHNGA